TEIELLNYSLNKGVPLLGICRGLQMLNVYFGGALKKCNNHISERHFILLLENNQSYEVNSYHGQAITAETLAPDLGIVALSEDGLIEAVCHQEHKMLGVQWHPERENGLKFLDRTLI